MQNNIKYFMKNPEKSNLKKIGFRYDAKSSTNDYQCYSYKFVVDWYKNTPVLICKLSVFLDNGECRIDLYNMDGSIYPAWYQSDNKFDYQKEYLLEIDKKIRDKIKKIGITKSVSE